MKAIVLAGGEGTRLRPLTAEQAKPMIKLLDVPVLEHIVKLLKKSGITDICMTLGYLPETVSGYFGDGKDFDVSIKYNVEHKPLGTAGGVAACHDFIGKDDFIVISGDAVCDFDIEQALAFHKQKNADATIIVTECAEPLEFGVVVAQADGRIEGFVEKPDWEHVRSNMINTGIYILSNSVLDSIPKDMVYDFSRDLFPKLMVNKKRLYSFEAKGYWRDIGNCESFMQCVYDALDGKIKIEKNAPEIIPGIYSRVPLDGKKVSVTPPVYIGEGASIEDGAEIGPYTVLGAKSIVKHGAEVRYSVVCSSSVGEYSVLDGCVVCRDAVIGSHAFVGEGAVIGEKTTVGDNCRIEKSVKIWPGRQIEPGSRVTENVVKGRLRHGLCFSDGASMIEEMNISVTAEDCVALGSAAAYMGRAAVGWGGSNGAKTLAAAFGSGVRSAGAELTMFDECFAAAAAYMGKEMGIPITVFFAQEGSSIKISFFGSDGRPISRELQRKIENLLSGGYERAPGNAMGGDVAITGVLQMYASAAVQKSSVCGDKCGVTAVITGEGPAAASFAYALTIMGARAAGHEKNAPQFEVSADGFSLKAIDENGRELSSEKVMAITAMTEFDRGEPVIHTGRYAPAAMDKLAKSYGGEIVRDDRENDVMYNAVFAAVRICSAMAAKHERLSDMADRAPEFAVSSREVPVKKDRGYVMKNLHYARFETSGDDADGFTISAGNGFVRIMPSRVRQALIIHSEADDAEIADELCADFEKLIRNADSDGENYDI